MYTAARDRFAEIFAVTSPPCIAGPDQLDDRVLASTLTMLSNCLLAVGREAEALEAIEEAVQVCRRLASAAPVLPVPGRLGDHRPAVQRDLFLPLVVHVLLLMPVMAGQEA